MNKKEFKTNGIEVYNRAKQNGLTRVDRWGQGIPHHPKSLEIMAFIEANDFYDYNDFGQWKSGGDGDNGETLMYEMDAYFEQKDLEKGEEHE